MTDHEATSADLRPEQPEPVPTAGCPTSEAQRGTERPDICTDCDGDCEVCR